MLCEAVIDGESFINLPVQYGIYKKQYYCLEKDIVNGKLNPTVSFLRGNGNAVAVVENYKTSQRFILECVRYLKKKKKKQKGEFIII